MTATQASAQAAPLQEVTAGDRAGSGDAGQPNTEFSSGIIPPNPVVEGANPPKFTTTDAPQGAQQEGAQGQQQGQEGGDAASNKSEGNQAAQALRKGDQNSQAGWQQVTEALGKINERMDTMEAGSQANAQAAVAEDKAKQEAGAAQAAEGNQQGADTEAMQKFVEGLENVNSRLDQMDWARSHPEIHTDPKLAKAWADVNADAALSGLNNDQKLVQAESLAGKSAKDVTKTLDGVIDQMQGGMPPEGGAAAVQQGNPAVDQETVEMGKVFGFTEQELTEELQ